jgi:predicted Zn finger-like uncharacterized protein
MRFVCDSCRAQYMISDDKVGAKGVKVRCKKCDFVILVRRPEAAELERTQLVANPLAAAEAAMAAAGGGTPAPEGSLFEGATEDEFGAVFDQVLSGGEAAKAQAASPSPDGLDSTRQLDLATARRLADASAQGGDAPSAPSASASDFEWFVAIDEKQVGPLSVDAVREHWEGGEISPDSLCWRTGMADWLPLSDVPELQRHLAPRPAKPVIVAPAAVTPASPAAPVGSAFAAGAGAKPGSPAPAAPGAAGGAGGWKPSAASALASLVQEEMAALSKPAPAKAPAPQAPASVPGLLDVPAAAAAPEAPLAPAAPQAPVAPYGAPAPQPYAPAPYAAPPTPYGAPYAAPVPPPARSSRGLVLGLAGALLVAGSVGASMLYMRSGGGDAPVAPAAPAVAQAPVAPPPAAPPPAPPAAVAQPATGTAAAPAVAAPAAGTAAPSAPTAVPAVAAAEPAKTAEPAEAAPAKAEPVKAEPAPRVAEAPRPARRPAEPRPAAARPERTEVAAAEPAPRPAARSDDPFEDIFGSPKAPAAAPKKAEAQQKPAVYVPPAPGAGSDIPESLGQSDIMQVVLSNKPSIVKCVQQQKASDPGASGKLVMRWTVQTSGRVSGISVQSPEFKDSQMASCITALIKTWTFPRHRQQGEPINFPFTF